MVGPDHVDTLESMVPLGAAYIEQGTLERGVQLEEKVVKTPEAILRKEHSLRFEALVELGLGYFRQGRLHEAIQLHTSALADFEHVFGPHHPHVLRALSNLAEELRVEERLKDAVRAQERAVKGMEVTYGVNHQFTTKGRERLDELRKSLETATAIHDVSTTPHLVDNKTCKPHGASDDAEKPPQRAIEMAYAVGNNVVLINNLPRVPDQEIVSRIAVLES